MSSQGQCMILNPKQIIEHLQNRTGENLLCRHDCALCATQNLHQVWCPNSNMTLVSVPVRLREVVKHYNTQYLIKPTDLPITASNLWRIIFRRQYSYRYLRQMSHKYIYIQQRCLDVDELKTNTTICRKAACSNQIGVDFVRIKSTVSIRLPIGRAMIYGAINLHYKYHGSSAHHEIYHHNKTMDLLGIQTSVITPRTSNLHSQHQNDIFMVYDDSIHFVKLKVDTVVIHHKYIILVL